MKRLRRFGEGTGFRAQALDAKRRGPEAGKTKRVPTEFSRLKRLLSCDGPPGTYASRKLKPSIEGSTTYPHRRVLGGSWVLTSPLNMVISLLTLLITLLISTDEPPNRHVRSVRALPSSESFPYQTQQVLQRVAPQLDHGNCIWGGSRS